MLAEREAHIIENLPGKSIHAESKSLRATSKGTPFFGRRGDVKLSALLQKTRYASGDNVYVAVKVRNSTARAVRGIKIELIRRVILAHDNSGEIRNKRMTEKVVKADFVSDDYKYSSNQERMSILNLNIPVNDIDNPL